MRKPMIDKLMEALERESDKQARRYVTAEKAKTAPPTPLNWGPVTVSESEFAELESFLTKPARPTQSIQNAARIMRRLYKLR